MVKLRVWNKFNDPRKLFCTWYHKKEPFVPTIHELEYKIVAQNDEWTLLHIDTLEKAQLEGTIGNHCLGISWSGYWSQHSYALRKTKDIEKGDGDAFYATIVLDKKAERVEEFRYYSNIRPEVAVQYYLAKDQNEVNSAIKFVMHHFRGLKPRWKSQMIENELDVFKFKPAWLQ